MVTSWATAQFCVSGFAGQTGILGSEAHGSGQAGSISYFINLSPVLVGFILTRGLWLQRYKVQTVINII